MKQHQVTHAGKGSRIGKDISRWSDEKNLGPFPVKGRLRPDTGDPLDLIQEKIHHVLEGMRFDPEMVPLAKTVGHRTGDPIDIQAQQVQELPGNNGYFCGVDAVGAKYGTAPALGALEKVTPPLFHYLFGKVPGPDHLSENLAGRGKFPSID